MAEWIWSPESRKFPNVYSDDVIVCPVCEETFDIGGNEIEKFNYCPNCGEKMR
jgi:predicted RNA-binding Zn-ribbon protein involved in translation (DUF1610 family)